MFMIMPLVSLVYTVKLTLSIYRSTYHSRWLYRGVHKSPAPPWMGWIICSTTSRSGRGAASGRFEGSSAGADLPELLDFLGSNWTNGCTFFLLFKLHFGAKTCTLLNFRANICHLHCSSDFSIVFVDLPKVFTDVSIVFIEFAMGSIDFCMVSIIFSMHNMHLVNM